MVAASEHVSLADLARYNEWQGADRVHLVIGQVIALDANSALALPPPAAAPPAALSELRALETTEQALLRDSDFSMWNATAPSSPAARKEPGSAVRRFASRILRRASTIAVSLTRSAMRFIGTPYVFGGTSTSGFDCSGYVQHVFALRGIHLPLALPMRNITPAERPTVTCWQAT